MPWHSLSAHYIISKLVFVFVVKMEVIILKFVVHGLKRSGMGVYKGYTNEVRKKRHKLGLGRDLPEHVPFARPAPESALALISHRPTTSSSILYKSCLQQLQDTTVRALSAMEGQKRSPNALSRLICNKISSFSNPFHPIQILPSLCNCALIKQCNSFLSFMEHLYCLIQHQLLVDLTQRAQKVRVRVDLCLLWGLNYLLLLFNTKAALIYADNPARLADTHSKVFRQPGKCVILV